MIILFFAALWAGCQNALAGGGSFITLPTLMFTGMDALSANVTSSVALFPSQAATGLHGWKNSRGVAGLSRGWLIGISLVGAALGAGLLLVTPSSIFARMVPWLVLFATIMFAWGSFGPKRADGGARLKARGAAAAQFCISVYGGYFGGGIGFLMLAALTAAGLALRNAGATKNLLAGVMNFSTVAILIFSPLVHWPQTAVACTGALIGGLAGAQMLNRVNEKLLRAGIIVIGVALTIGLFLRTP
jgi:uncharacterized membrane protein YfcA